MTYLFLTILTTSSLALAFTTNDQPTTRESVQSALQTLRSQSPSSVSVGQAVFIDSIETWAGTSPVLRTQEATTILQKRESGNTVQLYLVYDRTDYYNGQTEYHREQGEVTYLKDKPSIFLNIPQGTYANLKVESTSFPTPEKVLKRPDCGGLKDCPRELTSQKVTFDFQNRQGQDYHYEVWGSEQVLFFASPLKLCESTLRQVGDHEVNVTLCQSVVDFTPSRQNP